MVSATRGRHIGDGPHPASRLSGCSSPAFPNPEDTGAKRGAIYDDDTGQDGDPATTLLHALLTTAILAGVALAVLVFASSHWLRHLRGS